MQRRRHADDELFRVHSSYLGPPGKTLPFPVPYRAIVPGLAVFVLALVVLSGAGIGVWRFAIAALLAGAAGKLADRFSSAERPVSALPSIAAHESGAPRPKKTSPAEAVLRPGHIPVHDLPPERAGRRQR